LVSYQFLDPLNDAPYPFSIQHLPLYSRPAPKFRHSQAMDRLSNSFLHWHLQQPLPYQNNKRPWITLFKKKPDHLQLELWCKWPSRFLFAFSNTRAFPFLFHGLHSFHFHKEIHFGVLPLFLSISVSRSGD